MRYTFVQLKEFVDGWRDLKLSDDDLVELEELLSAHPDAGKVIPGAAGIRKIRFAPRSKHRGKRGGTRVCYAYVVVDAVIYLFTIYAKNVDENLSTADKRAFWRLLQALKEKKP